MLFKIYQILNGQPKFIKKLLPVSIKKKIKNLFFNFYFLPTNYLNLPSSNYINKTTYDYQKKLINSFKKNLKQSSFMTYPHLIELLLSKYSTDEKIVFLDVGADNIDFFLELNNKFKNLKYIFCNLRSVNNIFDKLKSENNYKNLIIINQLEDVFSENIDFINFGSSIEYFDNYEFILEKLTNIGKIIFFSGTTLFETENKKYEKHMVVKQINLYPDINYLYFFNKKNLYQIFLKKNFNLLFEKKNITDDVDYKNFNKFFDNINYMDFLFIKKG